MSSCPKTIYLDNAATTFPKPPQVIRSMLEGYECIGVSPGRGSYDLAVRAEEFVSRVRKQISDFFGSHDPNRVIFSYNATDALNNIIFGLANPGCHVVSSRLEHNSVLRPLHFLREQGLIDLDMVPFDSDGFIDPQDVERAIRPETGLVILTHASNVLGTIQPVEEIGRICCERNVPLVIDASQSAGVIPINMMVWHLDAIAFTGHKSLLGPTGIGGLVIRDGLEVRSTRFGGTGVDSASLVQTSEYPQHLEPGTINMLGVIGLSSGMRYIAEMGIEHIYEYEMDLFKRLRDGLASFKRVRLYCADTTNNHLPLLTLNIDGINPADLGAILDGDFNIAVRSGLHCAPLVHQDLGTIPNGGVRFSLGPSNTIEDIDTVLEAFQSILESSL
ncbi:MAG: aminotransferase class V-fold PLP-dependent enzyme [Desulfomonilaceae bacterium]